METSGGFVHLMDNVSFRAGDTVELSSTLQTHAKSYRVVWEGDFKLK